MLPQSFLVFVSALAVGSAGPVRRACASVLPSSATVSSKASATTTVSAVASTSSAATTPALPTGVTPELPTANGTLLYIALGHGIQNYTCSTAGANATSIGALAVLYDITALYPTLTEAQQQQLSVDILHQTAVPLNLADTNTSDTGKQYAADPADPFQARPDPAVTLASVADPLAALGRHYFDAALTPTFDLYAAATAGTLFKGGKLADVHAPADADPGLFGTGAVDWLQLGDKGASVGLTEVYRVITAGGNGLNCTAAGQTFSVPYSAEYWFYDFQS